ncbi:MAG: hypothetical protein AAF573_06540 [Bacteroidota bacterium]
MKYPKVFFALVFVLFFNSPTFAQYDNLFSLDRFSVQNQAQMNEVARDMTGMLQEILEASQIIDSNGNLLIDFPEELEGMELNGLEVTIEISMEAYGELQYSSIPTIDMSMIQAMIIQNLQTIRNSGQNRWLPSNQGDFQNVMLGNNVSIMRSGNNFYWLTLEHINTPSKATKQPSPSKNFRIANWEGQLGQGISRYY